MFNQYPYLNINDLNLDFVLNAIREMKYEVTNFVSINAIKYANPIQWNITSQYEKNTIVIDPVTGTAYISVAPVPAGVALTRPEYWTVVFDLGSFVTRAAQNFTSRYEQETTLTATFPTNTGEWLVWGDVLYKALSNIIAGDTYVVGSNIEHFTIEDLYNAYLNTIANILSMIGDLTDLDTVDKSNIVNAINEVVTNIGDLSTLTTTDKSNIVNAINELDSDLAQEISNRINKPYINVKDFGAIGDGLHDETAAFLAAYNACDNGGCIIVPFGDYYIDNNFQTNAKVVSWLLSYGTKISNNTNFPNLINNIGNVSAGMKRNAVLTSLIPPVGNGIVADSIEVLDGHTTEYFEFTGTLLNGSSIITTNDDISNIYMGYGILLVSPSDPAFPDGTTRANTMRVCGIDRDAGEITIGPDISNGNGAAVATPWTGASIYNGTFKARRRIWNCASFIGVQTGDMQNVDHYDWGLNIVANNNGSSSSAMEIEVNLNADLGDIARGIMITGQGSGITTPAAAIDIQRGEGKLWEWGISMRHANFGLSLSCARPIYITTTFHNSDFGVDSPIAYGITFDTTDPALLATRPLFSGKQIENGGGGLVIQRFTDSTPSGAMICCISEDLNDQFFRVDAEGWTFGRDLRSQTTQFQDVLYQSNIDSAFLSATPSEVIKQRIDGATTLIIEKNSNSNVSGLYIDCCSPDSTNHPFRVAADGRTIVADLQLLKSKVGTVSTIDGYIEIKDENNNTIKLATVV